jgi:hypothetical protein
MRSEIVITRILQANRKESLCQVESSAADTDPLHLPNMASAFFIYLWLFITAVVAITMKRAIYWVYWTDARRAAQKNLRRLRRQSVTRHWQLCPSRMVATTHSNVGCSLAPA